MARPLRYTFILVLVAAGTALAAVGGWRYARASAPVSGPIILISIDGLRADHLPVYGYTGVRAPAFDALGADGVVFERAYAHIPQSFPSHVSILSGRLPFETGVRDEVGFAVHDSERMLAEILRDRDFSTAGVVSSFALRKDTGLAQGFELYDDNLSNAIDGIRDGESAERAAETWLQNGHATRAFLFLQLGELHRPFAPSAVPSEFEPYDGAIARADHIVGRLVRYLKTHQLYDQSTIILVSAHGEGLDDHGEAAHGLFIYDEAVRVPLIVKPAAGEGTGQRVRDIVQLVDLMPTILDLAKAPAPGNIRGRSLRPLLDGSGRLSDRVVYSESFFGHYHFGWGGLTSVTDGRYRYIHAPHPELYDLQDDPRERENLIDDRPDVAARLRTALGDFFDGSSLPIQGDVSADDREQLTALGNVGDGPSAGPDDATLGLLIDPKDAHEALDTYRAAVDHDRAREWPEAIALLERMLRNDPASAELWRRLGGVAGRAGRPDLAVDAFKHAIALDPEDASGLLGLASALLTAHRPGEARTQAERAAARAGEDASLRRSARELIVRSALAAHDAAGAIAEAELAEQLDPERPLAAYVEGRLLLEDRRYQDALLRLDQAIDDLHPPILDLHASTAQALVRLDRYGEAEYHFLEELSSFPSNTRARADLASLYYAMERRDEAAQVLDDLVRITPTPDGYLLAARTWMSVGEPQRAALVRAEGQRRFPPAPPRARPIVD